VLSSLDSRDRLAGVGGGDGGNDDSLKARVLQHLIIIAVDGNAFKMGFGPICFILYGSEGSNELGARSSVVEVEGMTSTHATETGNGNLKLLGHDELCEEEVREESE
jgi:hypothetical protein